LAEFRQINIAEVRRVVDCLREVATALGFGMHEYNQACKEWPGIVRTRLAALRATVEPIA